MAVYFYYGNQSYREFSNFYHAPMRIDGKVWPTVEHYFQAMKSLDETVRETIRLLPTPREAKRAGRKVSLREDWEDIKEEIMLKALRAKFLQHPLLRVMLLETGHQSLHENSPYDWYWGMKGKDRLGKLLMQVREELKS